MHIQQNLVALIDDVLNLNGRGASMNRDTELLGALPELDSVSIMAVIAALEKRFNFIVEPNELDSASFATLGSLTEFVSKKLAEPTMP